MKEIILICFLLSFGFNQPLWAQTLETRTVSTYPNNIRKDYKLLEEVINQEIFTLPPSMGYRIAAELKDDYSRLRIFESRPHFRQEFTLRLSKLVRFTLLPDTTGYNKEAVHFVLQMEDSVLVETTRNHQTEYSEHQKVIFTLESPYLIAKAEVLLNNICRDNYRRRKWMEAKKKGETYCPPKIND